MSKYHFYTKLKTNFIGALIIILFIVMKISKKNYLVGKEKYDLEKLELAKSLIKIYSELYDFTRHGYIRPIFSNITNNYSTDHKNLNICVCSIGKNENLYIKEFIEYYLEIGIDKIFIYDNNDIEGESFENILTDYIKNKYVEIIDVRGLSSIQIPTYNHCYRKNMYLYDWIGFLDIDEYLFIENKENIKNFFYDKKFNKCQSIFFNWIMFNDNNLIKFDNRNLIQRFPHPVLNSSEGKSFVRGNIKNLILPTTHIAGINLFHFCNSNGELIYPNNFISYKFLKEPKAYIKHYYTKTAEEFCNKLNKGNAHFHKNHPEYQGSIKLRLRYFFKINKMTKEKINILEKCTNIKLNKFKKLFLF